MDNFDDLNITDDGESSKNKGLSYLEIVKIAEKYIKNHNDEDNASQFIDKIFQHALSNSKIYDDCCDGTVNECRDTLLRILCSVPTFYLNNVKINNIIMFLFACAKNSNEENAINSIRIANEIFKFNRPIFSDHITDFLTTLPIYFRNVQKNSLVLTDINEFGRLRDDTEVAQFPLLIDFYNFTSSKISDSNIVMGINSCRTLREILNLMTTLHKYYRQHVVSIMESLVPQMLHILGLQPSRSSRNNLNFDRDLFVDFVTLQLKIISFLLATKFYNQNEKDDLGLLHICYEKIVIGAFGILRYIPVDIPHVVGELLGIISHLVPYDKSGLIYQNLELILRSVVDSCRKIDSDSYKAQVILLVNETLVYHSERLAPDVVYSSISGLLDLLLSDLIPTNNIKKNTQIMLNMIDSVALKTIKRKLALLMLRKISSHLSNINNTLFFNFDDLKIDGTYSSKSIIRHFSVLNSCFKALINMLILVKGNQFALLPNSEVKVMRHVFKYGIFVLSYLKSGIIQPDASLLKNETFEEVKQLGENFSSLFVVLPQANIVEILCNEINILFDKLSNCSSLHHVATEFLNHQITSSIFSFMFLKFFSEKYKKFSAQESSVYIRFLKTVLGTTLIHRENEFILKDWVNFIIKISMNNIIISGQTLNYLLLLRALFRSIGNSANDILYQEFIPQLKNILLGFVRYRTALGYGVNLEMIIELTLSIPVRLSNLVPHIPMIMEPLTASLKTSSAINSQGHRTLEMCLEALVTLFADNPMDKVRNDIIVELCRRICGSSESNLYSIRLLGKMSGSCSKPYEDYQTLDLKSKGSKCFFNLNCKSVTIPFNIDISDAINFSVECLREASFTFHIESQMDPAKHIFMHNVVSAWHIIKTYICTVIPPDNFKKYLPNMKFDIEKSSNKTKPESINANKGMLKVAFTGVLYCTKILPVRSEAFEIMVYTIRVCTLLLLIDHIPEYGNYKLFKINFKPMQSLRPSSYISSIFTFLRYSGKKNMTRFIILLIVRTTTSFLEKNIYKFSDTIIFKIIARKCVKYANLFSYAEKRVAITILRQICLSLPPKEVELIIADFYIILFDSISGLYCEISSGTLELAGDTIIALALFCYENQKNPESFDQNKINVIVCCVKQLHSYSEYSRSIAQKILEILSNIWSVTIYHLVNFDRENIIESYKKISASSIWNKPLSMQLAEINALVFYSTINPPFIDWNLPIDYMDTLALSFVSYVESESFVADKNPFMKNNSDITSLRLAAFKFVDIVINIPRFQNKMFLILSQTLINSEGDILLAAKSSLMKLNVLPPSESRRNTVSILIRPLLVKLANYQSFDAQTANVMRCVIEVFPEMFNDRLYSQLIMYLQDSLREFSIRMTKNESSMKPLSYHLHKQLEHLVVVIDCFHVMPCSNFEFVHSVLKMFAEIKINFCIREFNDLYRSLIKYLNKHPRETFDFFVQSINDESLAEIFIILLKSDINPNMLVTHLVKNPFPIFRYVFPNIDFDHSVINLDHIQNSKLYVPFNVFWVAQKKRANFIHVFPHVLTVFRKVWAVIFYRYDEFRDKICHIICKVIFSHLFHFFDPNIFLEFIIGYTLPSTYEWLNTKLFPSLFRKLSFEGVINLTHHIVSFYQSTEANSFTRKNLLKFLIKLFRFKLHNENIIINDSFFEPLRKIVDGFINNQVSLESPTSVRILILKFLCIFLKKVPTLFKETDGNITSSINNMINFVKIGLKLQRYYDHKTRIQSFYIISLAFNNYSIDMSLIKKVFLELLKMSYIEFKRKLVESLHLLITKLSKNEEYFEFIVSSICHSLQTFSRSFKSYIIFTTIIDHSSIFKNAKDSLYPPIINALIYNSPLSPPFIENNKLMYFEMTKMLIDWADFNKSNLYHLSMILSLVIKNYIFFSETHFQSMNVTIQPVQETIELIKYSVTKNIFQRLSISFKKFDFRQRINDFYSISHSYSTIQNDSASLFKDCINRIKNLFVFLLKNIKEDKIIIDLLQNYVDDIIKLISNNTSDEINNEMVILVANIFNRFPDPHSNLFSKIETLFSFCKYRISEAYSSLENIDCENKENLIRLIMLGKMLPNLKSHLLEIVIKSHLNVLRRFNKIKHNDSNIRAEILSHIIHITSILVSDFSTDSQSEIFLILSNFCINYHSFPISIALFHVISEYLDFYIKINIINESTSIDFINFIHHYIRMISVHYALEYDVQTKVFKKIAIVFYHQDIFPPTNTNYKSIYMAGLLNFFYEVRELYFSMKPTIEDFCIPEKFNYLLNLIPHLTVTPFNSWLKLLLKILFIPKPSFSVCLSSVYDTLWYFHNHYLQSNNDDINPYNSGNTAEIVDMIYSISEKDDNYDLNIFRHVFNNLDFGYDQIKRTDKTEKYFYKCLSDLIYFYGDLADIMFKKNFNVFWKSIIDEDKKVITSNMERFLISNGGKSINDKAFIKDILENCSDFRITLSNGNLNREGIYYFFTSTTKTDEKLLKERFISLYQISSLPVCSTNTLMCSIINADPPIIIFPSIVSFVGKNSICQYDCALYLEKYHNELKMTNFFDFTDLERPFDFKRYNYPSPLNPIEVFLALETLYNDTSEDLYTLSIWNMNCIFGSTVTGLSYMHHGFYQQASINFEELISEYERDHNESMLIKNPFFKHESRIWHQSWMTCQKELGFWGRLNKYTKNKISENCNSFELEMALSSAWKVLDFQTMKNVLTIISSQAPKQILENYQIHFYKAIYTLFSKECNSTIKSNEYIIDQIFSGFRDLSKKLSNLPQIIIPAHIKIFKTTHLFSELNEVQRFLSSCQNMSGTNQGIDSNITSIHNELKTGSKTWRYHYTEKFDTLSHLNEVTLLRLFSITKRLSSIEFTVTKSLYNADMAIPRFLIEPFTSQYYESSLNILNSQILSTFVMHNWIKFTYQSRKQGNYLGSLDCSESAKGLLLNFQTTNLNFQILVQEAKSYLDLHKHTNDECYLVKSLDLINNDFLKRQLSKENMAITVGIRGLIQSKIGLVNEANISFAESLLKCESSSAWAGWAFMLDRIYQSNRDLNTGVNSFISYMNACKNSTSYYKVCKYIFSLFHLLELDSSSGEFSVVFENNIQMISSCHLVKFIDKLISNLNKTHGDRFIGPISSISQANSQLIYSYIHLNEYIFQNEPDYEITFPHSINISQNAFNEKLSDRILSERYINSQMFKRIKTISQFLHLNFSSSIFYLDTFIDVYDEIYESSHERIYRLFKICINMAYKDLSISLDLNCTPSNLLKEYVDKLNYELVKEYKNEHNKFYQFSSKSIKDLVKGLKEAWDFFKIKIYLTVEKTKILTQVHKAFYSLLYGDIQMDLPGEHWFQKVDTINLNSTKIIKYYTISETTIKPYGINNRIRFVCNNGTSTSYIIVKNRSYHENFQEESLFDIFYFCNMIFNNHKNTWKENLRFEIPKFVNYRPNLKLYQDDKTDISLLQILIQHLKIFECDEIDIIEAFTDFRILKNRNCLSENNTEIISKFEKLESEYIPRNVLSNWAHEKYPSSISYFTFRKKFTKKMAIASLFQSILCTLPLFPDTVVINTKTGCVNFKDLTLEKWISDPLLYMNNDYRENSMLRLTPNITEFITNIGIHGIFAHSMFSVANSIYNSINFWPNIIKINLKKSSESWKYILQPQEKNIMDFIDKVHEKINKKICEYGNVENALIKIRCEIDFSLNPLNIIQEDVLWIPLI